MPFDELHHADQPLSITWPEEPTVLCTSCNCKLPAGPLVLQAATTLEPQLAALASTDPDCFLYNYSIGDCQCLAEISMGADTLAQLLTLMHDYRHRPTCFQVKKFNGPVRFICRAKFPRQDSDVALVPRKPGSSWLNPHNGVILKLLSCISCVNLLHS